MSITGISAQPAIPAEQERARRIEELVDRLEAIGDDELRAHMQELMRLILDWYAEALARLLSAAGEAPHVEALLAAWARDACVAALCELHGLAIPRRPAAAQGLVSITSLTARSA